MDNNSQNPPEIATSHESVPAPASMGGLPYVPKLPSQAPSLTPPLATAAAGPGATLTCDKVLAFLDRLLPPTTAISVTCSRKSSQLGHIRTFSILVTDGDDKPFAAHFEGRSMDDVLDCVRLQFAKHEAARFGTSRLN